MTAELNPATVKTLEALKDGEEIVGFTLGGGLLHGLKRTGPDGAILWDVDELGGAYRTVGLNRVGSGWRPATQDKKKA